MKNILILGAGQSTPFLINYLLDEAKKNNWFVTVCDRDINAAAEKVNGQQNGQALEFDVNDEQMRHSLISKSDIVVNLLSPLFQHLISLDCLNFGKHCVTASYTNPKVALLNNDAIRKGILFLNEMGLDPGIDHMMSMALVHKVREGKGIITDFISYGSGLPAPDVKSNPLNYCITWNAHNVVMAGYDGAQFMENHKIKVVDHNKVFKRTWPVEVDGVGTLEAYPNRDSLIYLDLFKLKYVKTMIRGTLRYPGWSETWNHIVSLGIPNDKMIIPHLSEKTYAEFTEMFMPMNVTGARIQERVANFLGISRTGTIMQNLEWLGLFSDEKIVGDPKTATDVMVDILNKKMPLPDGKRDMVILLHKMKVEYPDGRKKKYTSSMIDYGEPNGITAIAKTVGAPAAIAAKLILKGELPLTGTHIPTHPIIYNKVLKELENLGLKFVEKAEDI